MKTREDVISMLESERGSQVAVRTTDTQGYNESHDVIEIDDVLDAIEEGGYEFLGCQPVTPADIDIEEWAQDFDEENRESLRESLADGELYVATFSSDECGQTDLLVWK